MSLNITPMIKLPGVGNNPQDHFLVQTQYTYGNMSITYRNQLNDAAVDDAARGEYYANRTGPYTAGLPDGVAFLSLPMLSNRSATLLSSASSAPSAYLAADLDPTLCAGYTRQHSLLLSALANRSRAATEILNNNAGALVVANMRPFSRGSVHIRSSNPFDDPLIDPRYGSNPLDLHVLREALLFNRALIATDAMALLQPSSFFPAGHADDDDLLDYIKRTLGTENNPSSNAPP